MQDMPSTEEMIAEVQTSGGQPEPMAEAPPQAEPSSIQEFEYQANGKTIKEPIETILKRASQGYNYAQHMSELKAQQAEIEKARATANELQQKYGEIDKFAKENPEWHDHLHKTWESRFDITGNQGQQHAQQQIPSQFQQEFNELRSFVESIKAERADSAYQSAFTRVKESYPDIDFTATDPDTGTTLEQQVLDYANQNGINRFEPAFKAFYADRLIERARTQAKEQMAGDIQKRSKAGLLGTSQAPSKAKSEWEYPANYKNMSDSQLHNWIVNKYADK